MIGRVIVGGVPYPNSWAEGKTYRQVTCLLCLDTGRHLTDDGALGDICDCTYGEAQHVRLSAAYDRYIGDAS